MVYKGLKAMAVDPLRGFIFLATNESVHSYNFTIDLGIDMMNPSLNINIKS